MTDQMANAGEGVTPASSMFCRLCGGTTRPAFQVTVLKRYDVTYLKCEVCLSLQTEPPYWLAEAYSDGLDDKVGPQNLHSLDTGVAQRNLSNMAATLGVARILGLKNAIDEGGGDGLLCRLLRDYGLNAFVHDRYARASYAQGFENPDFQTPDLVTAFEVLEHFASPREDLEKLFAGSSAAVLITTETYSGQGPDWWYLIPETGHHVFFYSERAFEWIAERLGYVLLRAGAYTLFVRPGRMRGSDRLKLRIALHSRGLRLLRVMLALHAPRGHERDFERVRANLELDGSV